MNSGYSEPPDIVNFLHGPFKFTIMRVHCTLRYILSQCGRGSPLAAAKLEYRLLKPKQGEVVKALLESNDVFAALPTGCGKSLCFAILFLELRKPF